MVLKEELIQRELSVCKHFNGAMNETCKAGVRYDDIRVGHLALPCSKLIIEQTKAQPGICNKLEFPTLEEATKTVEQDTKRIHDNLVAVAVAGSAAAMQGLGKGKPGIGETACPVCEGRLRFVMAANGHLHGRCETPGCVQWMS